MWACGRSPHTHIYPSYLLAGGFFTALIVESTEKSSRQQIKAVLFIPFGLFSV